MLILELVFFHQFGFAAADAVTGLKLIEAGVPKESLAMIAVPLVPLQILLPFVLSKLITGKIICYNNKLENWS